MYSECSDTQLLERYLAGHDRAAMQELVTRHIGFVHACAMRQVRGDSHLASDVTQAVFILLANKAPSLGRGVVLRSWLFTTVRYASSNAIRLEVRRRRHEREAAMLRSEAIDASSDIERQEMHAALDDAIAQLSPVERAGILLRFFDGKSFPQVGSTLGLSEDAARKRVNRAIEKIQRQLLGHGIQASDATLASSLASVAVSSALVESTMSSMWSATTAFNFSAARSIAKGVEKMIMLSKLKIAAAVLVACTMVGGTFLALAGEQSHNPPATAPATGAAAIARVNDELSIRIAGIAKCPIDQKSAWWNADGSSANEACDASAPESAPAPSYLICMQLQVPDEAGVVWMTTANGHSVHPARRAGADVKGLYELSVITDLKAIDLTAKIATSPWQTLSRCSPRSAMCDFYTEGAVQGDVSFAPPLAVENGTMVTVAHTLTDCQSRIVAIDRNGETQTGESQFTGQPGKLRQTTVRFDLVPDQIDHLELQVRTFDHIITFKNVTLDPQRPTQVEISTREK